MCFGDEMVTLAFPGCPRIETVNLELIRGRDTTEMLILWVTQVRDRFEFAILELTRCRDGKATEAHSLIGTRGPEDSSTAGISRVE